MVKKRLVGVISLLCLVVAYLILRFPLFYLHGMKQWSMILLCAGILVVTISGLVFCNKWIPAFTVIGYIFGFIIGYVFQFDYGIGLNSMWIIWTISYVAIMVVGIVVAIVVSSRFREKYWYN